MLRSKKLLALAMALLGTIVFASPPQARAGYSYTIYDDGVAQTGALPVTPGGNSFATILSTTHFQISIASSFTTPSQDATVLQTQLQAQLNATGGTHTIQIKLAYDGYVLPAGSPLNASSSGSATFTNSSATTDSASFQAWGVSGSSSAFQNGTTGGAQTANSPGGSTTPITLSPATSIFLLPNPTNTFSLSQTLSLTLGNGATNAGQVQGTTTVTVPAPAGVILALTGMPVLGFAGWLRRRGKKA